MLRLLIVDDESLARESIRDLLESSSLICEIKEAGTVEDARVILDRNKIDGVFLDINLQGESGFDLVPFVPERTRIVFVTAFDQHAIRAFEVNALDYILKPPGRDRLLGCLKRISEGLPPAENNLQLTLDDRLFIRGIDKVQFVMIRDIHFITVDRDYSTLHGKGGRTFLVRKTLKSWKNILPERDFIRIHRSTIVNLNVVERMVPFVKGRYHIYVTGRKDPLILSRRYADRIKELIF